MAIVIQQLIDITPLPTLLMRTVLQSMTMYPRLSTYIINILQRLIIRQVQINIDKSNYQNIAFIFILIKI